MDVTTRSPIWLAVLVLVAGAPAVTVAQEPGDAVESARTWVGRHAEAEAYLRAAEIVALDAIGAGVTEPMRATLAPGGPVEAFAWKPIKPGIYRGYWESYRSEIAAYELDKLLGLGLTPPTVERRIRGDLGAAVWWVSPARTFKALDGPPRAPNAQIGRWNLQLIRAKMFHNLIYNRDPNLGNWLVDPAWNLIIIDNSRALTGQTGKRVHALKRVEQILWDRMAALDETMLTAAVGEWLSENEIRAILVRRDEMRADIDRLVAQRGAHDVFVRLRGRPETRPATATVPPPVETAPVTPLLDLDALAHELVSALRETPVVMAASEISWLGRVVRLADYDGPDASVARAGLAAGHHYGLVTDSEGLVCLGPDHRNPTPYAGLESLVGRRAELFGVEEEIDGVSVAHVTLVRAR